MPRIVSLSRLLIVFALVAAALGTFGRASAGLAQDAGRPLTPPLALESARVERDGPITLNSVVSVDGAYVRLSDIFQNLPPDQDAVVAPAPRPGQQAVYDVDWLRRVTGENGVVWRPVSRFDSVTVVRDSRVVGRSDIIEALRPFLADQGMPPQAELSLNTTASGIHIDAAADARVGVLETEYDPGTQRFTALVEIPAGAPAAQRQRITGRAFLTTAVPVLTGTMRHGEVIEPADIDFITLRVDQLKRDTITDPEQLIGRTPRRFVQAGSPVLGMEVDLPRLVDKGAVVTMIYQTPYLRLTTQGRALDHGGVGDQVRVQNMQSNSTVTATVTDQNTVAVRTGMAAGN